MLGKAGHTKFDLARDSWSLICGFANSQLIGRDRKDKYVQVNIQGLGQLSEIFGNYFFGTMSCAIISTMISNAQ